MLSYTPGAKSRPTTEVMVYDVDSPYAGPLKSQFAVLKAHVAGLNPALVTKCITGTEQDFLALMQKARECIQTLHLADTPEAEKQLLEMFRVAIFGYYVLDPLIQDKKISDIKVFDYNRIVVKARGKRYITKLSFLDEADYKDWFERIMRINHLPMSSKTPLQDTTDIKWSKACHIRIDVVLSNASSSGTNIIHLRKVPTTKESWENLKADGMLDDDIITYLADRVLNGYGFLVSGHTGSGKTVLLNKLIDLIPLDQSGLITQANDELFSCHPQMQIEHTVDVGYGDNKTTISLEDELRLGLLQDADNVIVGEVKGGEALYVFILGMSTGSRFMGTIHSDSARDSIHQLARYAENVSRYTEAALEKMVENIPLTLVHMSHYCIDEIVEVDGWDSANQRLNFRDVFKKGGNA